MAHRIAVNGKVYGVRFDHTRYDEHPTYNGTTICAIFDYSDPDNTKEAPFICDGVAYCSKHDQFNRRFGRKVSLADAIKGLFNRQQLEERRQFWSECFKLGIIR